MAKQLAFSENTRQQLKVGVDTVANAVEESKGLEFETEYVEGMQFDPATPNPITGTRRQRGQSLVEFMLVIPILLLTIFGLIEMARLVISYATIQHAAQEGARVAATGKCLPDYCEGSYPVLSSIENTALDSTVGLIIDEDALLPGDPGYLEVMVRGTDSAGKLHSNQAGDPGQKTYVNVTYSMPVITPFISSIAPSVTLHSEVIVTNESQGGTLSQEGVLPPPLQLEEFQEGPGEEDDLDDDWEEYFFGSPGLYRNDDDPDGDLCDNLCEFTCGASLPGVGENRCTTDPDISESDWPGTLHPTSGDTDGDGMDDLWELLNGTKPDVADDEEDPDGDGKTNYEEFLADTDPLNPDDFPGAMEVAMSFNPVTMNQGEVAPVEVAVVVTDFDDDPIIGIGPGGFSWTFDPDPGTPGNSPGLDQTDPPGTYTFLMPAAGFAIGKYNITVFVDDGTSSEEATGAFYVYDASGNFLTATLTVDPPSIAEGLVSSVDLLVYVEEEGFNPVTGLAAGNFNWTTPVGNPGNFQDLGGGNYSFTLDGVDTLAIGGYTIDLEVNDGTMLAPDSGTLNVVSSVQTLAVNLDVVPQSVSAGTSTVLLPIRVTEEGGVPKADLVMEDFSFDLGAAPGSEIVLGSFANMNGGNYVFELDVSDMSESGGFYSVTLTVDDGDAIGVASAPFTIGASVPTCQVSGGAFSVRKKSLMWDISNDGTEMLSLRSVGISWSGNHGTLKQARWGIQPNGKKGKYFFRGNEDTPAAFGEGGLPWYRKSTPEQRQNPAGNTGSFRFDWKSKAVARQGNSFSIVAEWEDLSGNTCVATGSYTN